MKKFAKIAIIVFGVVLMLAIIGTALNSDEIVLQEMDKTSIKIAEDLIKQYDIALRNNNITDAWVQASSISQSYLSAKDEKNYLKWKKTADSLEAKIQY